MDNTNSGLKPWDETELRIEARRLYREKGSLGVWQAVVQFLNSANIFLDILKEEGMK